MEFSYACPSTYHQIKHIKQIGHNMPLRFFYRKRITPWASVNMTKNGPSLSVGVPGAHVTFGRRLRGTIGIPGTGVYYTESVPLQFLRSRSGDITFHHRLRRNTLVLIIAVAAFGAVWGASTASIFYDFL
jgi:hypothetical protein